MADLRRPDSGSRGRVNEGKAQVRRPRILGLRAEFRVPNPELLEIQPVRELHQEHVVDRDAKHKRAGTYSLALGMLLLFKQTACACQWFAVRRDRVLLPLTAHRATIDAGDG